MPSTRWRYFFEVPAADAPTSIVVAGRPVVEYTSEPVGDKVQFAFKNAHVAATFASRIPNARRLR